MDAIIKEQYDSLKTKANTLEESINKMLIDFEQEHKLIIGVDAKSNKVKISLFLDLDVLKQNISSNQG